MLKSSNYNISCYKVNNLGRPLLNSNCDIIARNSLYVPNAK